MYRILVADDEPIERQVINKKIKAFFPNLVEVFVAENGIEAVKKYTENMCLIKTAALSFLRHLMNLVMQKELLK